MHKSIFEALYYGKINPSERKVRATPEKNDIERTIQALKNYFRKEFSAEDYERLEELENLYTEYHDCENINLFAHGFTVGALIMLEVSAGVQIVVNE